MGVRDLRDDVRRELDALRPLAELATPASLRDGSWLTHVVDQVLDGYAEDVFAAHPGLAGDDLADARIARAQRRALVAGGLSAGAYASVVMGAVATGVGTVLALPAAVTAFSVDLFYTTRVQLRLGRDLGQVYGVDLSDPLDLVQTAFGVDRDRAVATVGLGFVPAASRLGSRAATTASRLLASTGAELARRGVAKFAFPAVGVPLCAGVNFYGTGVVGRRARNLLRGRARARGVARQALDDGERIRQVLMLVVHADARVRAAEQALIDALGGDVPALVGEDEVLDAVRAANAQERAAVVAAAVEAVALDGRLHRAEDRLLRRLAEAAGVPFDPRAVSEAVWAMGRDG